MSWWESAYRSGSVNWDPGEYDRHLPWLLSTFDIAPCRAIDLGCGTGKSAVWLAEHGFDVVGVDLAPTAIRNANELARVRGVSATFVAGEFPGEFTAGRRSSVLGSEPFGLAIERGFLQHFGPGRELDRVLRAVVDLLAPDALFYSLITAREGKRARWGPRLWSESEVRESLGAWFRIRHMELSVFTPDEAGSMPAWLTVMDLG
ncbi:MAG: class I SAM-dependent methyltransferase [Spirochaetaceae bacterium]|nr:MAG: class I SAM-dependent methyltransferase [Spirochaetaceae bacterium]